MLPGEKEIRNPRRRVVRRIARSTASESQDLAVENQKSIYGQQEKVSSQTDRRTGGNAGGGFRNCKAGQKTY
jgi:hypothetical protein